MREIKIRYVFKRKSDGHIWMLITSIEGIEDGSGQLSRMLENELWGLVSRDVFSGLKDKNGREIYEGDIVSYVRDYLEPMYEAEEPDPGFAETTHTMVGHITIRPSAGVVINGWREVRDYSTQEFLQWGHRSKHSAGKSCMSEYAEVIGNIHESPELLEAS